MRKVKPRGIPRYICGNTALLRVGDLSRYYTYEILDELRLENPDLLSCPVSLVPLPLGTGKFLILQPHTQDYVKW